MEGLVAGGLAAVQCRRRSSRQLQSRVYRSCQPGSRIPATCPLHRGPPVGLMIARDWTQAARRADSWLPWRQHIRATRFLQPATDISIRKTIDTTPQVPFKSQKPARNHPESTAVKATHSIQDVRLRHLILQYVRPLVSKPPRDTETDNVLHFPAVVLLLNAVAILSQDRFLARSTA